MPKNKAILVVDDEFEIVSSITMILEEEGYSIASASNGLEALALLKQHRYGLVMLDVMMPELNGLQTLAEMRSKPRTRQTPVVMMSAVRPESTAAELGCSDFLHKPFTLDDLLATALRYCK